MLTFDRDDARLLLEICRYTYAAGVEHLGDAADKVDQEDAWQWINELSDPEQVPLNEHQVPELKRPFLVRGDGKDSNSAACIVAYRDRNVVAYMGTETEFNPQHRKAFRSSLGDWADDAKATPVPFELKAADIGASGGGPVKLDGLVHRGFLQQLTGVQSKVIEKLMELGGKARPLIVTGHSQGGAVAALATGAFAKAGFDVAATYTFAAPRSGTKEYAESIEELKIPVFRIEFGNDLVPHLPSSLIRHTLQKLPGGQLLGGLLHSVADAALKKLTPVVEQFAYVGLGPLTYGTPSEGKMHLNLSAEEEAKLFQQRLAELTANPPHWMDHHHLAGTDAEMGLKPSKRGNYTVLVSDWEPA